MDTLNKAKKELIIDLNSRKYNFQDIKTKILPYSKQNGDKLPLLTVMKLFITLKKEKNVACKNILLGVKRFLRLLLERNLVKPMGFDANTWDIFNRFIKALENTINCTNILKENRKYITHILASLIDLNVLNRHPSEMFNFAETLLFINDHLNESGLDVLLHCETLIKPQHRNVQAFLPILRKILNSVRTTQYDKLTEFLKLCLLARIVMSIKDDKKCKIVLLDYKHKLKSFAANFEFWANDDRVKLYFSNCNSIKSLIRNIPIVSIYKILYPKKGICTINNEEVTFQKSKLKKKVFNAERKLFNERLDNPKFNGENKNGLESRDKIFNENLDKSRKIFQENLKSEKRSKILMENGVKEKKLKKKSLQNGFEVEPTFRNKKLFDERLDKPRLNPVKKLSESIIPVGLEIRNMQIFDEHLDKKQKKALKKSKPLIENGICKGKKRNIFNEDLENKSKENGLDRKRKIFNENGKKDVAKNVCNENIYNQPNKMKNSHNIVDSTETSSNVKQNGFRNAEEIDFNLCNAKNLQKEINDSKRKKVENLKTNLSDKINVVTSNNNELGPKERNGSASIQTTMKRKKRKLSKEALLHGDKKVTQNAIDTISSNYDNKNKKRKLEERPTSEFRETKSFERKDRHRNINKDKVEIILSESGTNNEISKMENGEISSADPKEFWNILTQNIKNEKRHRRRNKKKKFSEIIKERETKLVESESNSDIELIEENCDRISNDSLQEESDIDEASGSDGDIVPCNDTIPMFTKEESSLFDKKYREERRNKEEMKLQKKIKDLIEMKQHIENKKSLDIDENREIKKIDDDVVLSLYKSNEPVTELKKELPEQVFIDEGSYSDDFESKDLQIIFETIEKDRKRLEIKKEKLEFIAKETKKKAMALPKTKTHQDNIANMISNLYKQPIQDDLMSNIQNDIEIIYDEANLSHLNNKSNDCQVQNKNSSFEKEKVLQTFIVDSNNAIDGSESITPNNEQSFTQKSEQIGKNTNDKSVQFLNNDCEFNDATPEKNLVTNLSKNDSINSLKQDILTLPIVGSLDVHLDSNNTPLSAQNKLLHNEPEDDCERITKDISGSVLSLTNDINKDTVAKSPLSKHSPKKIGLEDCAEENHETLSEVNGLYGSCLINEDSVSSTSDVAEDAYEGGTSDTSDDYIYKKLKSKQHRRSLNNTQVMPSPKKKRRSSSANSRKGSNSTSIFIQESSINRNSEDTTNSQTTSSKDECMDVTSLNGSVELTNNSTQLGEVNENFSQSGDKVDISCGQIENKMDVAKDSPFKLDNGAKNCSINDVLENQSNISSQMTAPCASDSKSTCDKYSNFDDQTSIGRRRSLRASSSSLERSIEKKLSSDSMTPEKELEVGDNKENIENNEQEGEELEVLSSSSSETEQQHISSVTVTPPSFQAVSSVVHSFSNSSNSSTKSSYSGKRTRKSLKEIMSPSKRNLIDTKSSSFLTPQKVASAALLSSELIISPGVSDEENESGKEINSKAKLDENLPSDGQPDPWIRSKSPEKITQEEQTEEDFDSEVTFIENVTVNLDSILKSPSNKSPVKSSRASPAKNSSPLKISIRKRGESPLVKSVDELENSPIRNNKSTPSKNKGSSPVKTSPGSALSPFKNTILSPVKSPLNTSGSSIKRSSKIVGSMSPVKSSIKNIGSPQIKSPLNIKNSPKNVGSASPVKSPLNTSGSSVKSPLNTSGSSVKSPLKYVGSPVKSSLKNNGSPNSFKSPPKNVGLPSLRIRLKHIKNNESSVKKDVKISHEEVSPKSPSKVLLYNMKTIIASPKRGKNKDNNNSPTYESEQRDTVPSPTKRQTRRYSKISEIKMENVETLNSPRKRRLSSTILSEAKLLSSPGPSRRRRTSDTMPLTPVRRSRRISGLPHEFDLDSKLP